MKSIQSGLLILIMSFVLPGCLLSGFCSIEYASHILQEKMSGNINLICEGDAPGYDRIYFSEEQSGESQSVTHGNTGKNIEGSVLNGGGKFALISEDDVNRMMNNLAKINLGIAFAVTGTACFSSVIFGRHCIIRTLKKLVDAAYSDSMTGVENKAAYDRMVTGINYDIERGNGNFAVIVIDVNNLKMVNDTYGHIAGDALICCISGCICETFTCGRVFRIGGDEFAVIIETTDPETCHELISEFKDRINSLFIKENPDIPVSAACGYAVFDKETDITLTDVFARADNSMYHDKKDKRE